ncbi:MAG: hypothetical protein FWF50_02130 [Defluviitaleaceae bacterium]|nr:hypothetical protein [Defluviitaleaceae bacterium]
MKRKLIAGLLTSGVLIFSLVILTTFFRINNETSNLNVVHAQTLQEYSRNNDTIIAELRRDIEELRALVEMLLLTLNNNRTAELTEEPIYRRQSLYYPSFSSRIVEDQKARREDERRLNQHSRNNRPTNTNISLERAIEIGYAEIARRGYTGTFRNNSGIDWEYGQWVWELLFRVNGGRLPLVEMYINVDSGNIVKFEWDE